MGPSSTLRRPPPPASSPSARQSCWVRGMADKDSSGTPLSQKLGAKPDAGVVVFFTASREDLEGRFEGLKATLGPADGLWIAWPKKDSEDRGRPDLRSRSRDRPCTRPRGQQVLLDRRALAGAALRVPARGSLGPRPIRGVAAAKRRPLGIYARSEVALANSDLRTTDTTFGPGPRAPRPSGSDPDRRHVRRRGRPSAAGSGRCRRPDELLVTE